MPSLKPLDGIPQLREAETSRMAQLTLVVFERALIYCLRKSGNTMDDPTFYIV